MDPSTLVIDEADRFRVSTAVYTDPDVYRAELRQIFYGYWVYVAHESQIPEPGDYITTTVGEQSVIVSRDQDRQLHVLINRCTHRGSVVCREERGHSNFFKCPYHNWVFESNGDLAGAAQKSGYPEDFPTDEFAMRRARCETYRGLIFASFNHDVEPLEERLAHVKRYIDMWCDRSPTGTVTTRDAVHRYEYPGNWKFQMENGVDGYHGNYVHDSFAKIVDRAGELSRRDIVRSRNEVSKGNHAKGLRHGDGLLERANGQMIGTYDLREDTEHRTRLEELYGLERAQDTLVQRNIHIFPNLYLMESHIRVLRPTAIDSTIVDTYPTFLEDTDERINRERLRWHERFYGPASFGAPDDIEIFVSNQTGVGGPGNDWLDMSRGLHREETNELDEWVGHTTDEAPQRSAYREWARLVGGLQHAV